MATPNNPAGRLHSILVQAFGKQNGLPMRAVWAELFKIEPSDTAAILNVSKELIQLVRNTRQSITKLEGVNTELYLQPIKQIERAFASLNLEQQLQQFKNNIDDGTMRSLEFCSDTLSQKFGEEIIDQDKLTKLREEVDALSDFVLKSDLEQILKNMILDNLENIRRAIVEYGIRGAEGLRTALDASIGVIIRNRGANKDSLKGQVFERFVSLIKQIDIVVSAGLRMQQLFGPMMVGLLQIGS